MENIFTARAKDDRLHQIQKDGLRWFFRRPSPVVREVMRQYSIGSAARILEIGCGEGRVTGELLEKGCDILAGDPSKEAVDFCKRIFHTDAQRFRTLAFSDDELGEQFDFVFSVSILHTLISDGERSDFYRFIHRHLKRAGVALVATLDAGRVERASEVTDSFEHVETLPGNNGKIVKFVGETCRLVRFSALERELTDHGFEVSMRGVISLEPDFPQIIFAAVKLP